MNLILGVSHFIKTAEDLHEAMVGAVPGIKYGLAFSEASSGLSSTILDTGLAPIAVVIGMLLILMFLGCFMDQVSMMMITMPIFMPRNPVS